MNERRRRCEQLASFDVNGFPIRQYADIAELDAVTLNMLVRQVVVDEEIGKDGARKISVEIHYKAAQQNGITDRKKTIDNAALLM